jgi:hypothetical protein
MCQCIIIVIFVSHPMIIFEGNLNVGVSLNVGVGLFLYWFASSIIFWNESDIS